MTAMYGRSKKKTQKDDESISIYNREKPAWGYAMKGLLIW